MLSIMYITPLIIIGLVFVIIGDTIIRKLERKNVYILYWERVIFSLLIGSFIVTWIFFICLLIHISILPVIYGLLIYVLFYVIRFLRLNLHRIGLLIGKSKLFFPKVFNKTITLIPILIIIISILSKSNMVSDGLFLWGFKARVLFEEKGLIQTYFKSPALIWSHQDYPLYLPFIEMFIYKLIGTTLEPSVFFIIPIFYFLCGVSLFFFLTTYLPFVFAYFFTITFFLVPLPGHIATLNYADIPLSLIYFVSIYALYRYVITKKVGYHIISVLLASGLFWIKKEGLILFLVYILGYLIYVFPNNRSWKERYLFFLSFIPSIIWIGFLKIEHIQSIDFMRFSFTNFVTHLHRVPEVYIFARRLLKFPAHWGLFWILFFIILILTTIRKKRINGYYLLVYFVVMPLLIYPCIFIFSTWSIYIEHVRTALDRLILQVFPLAFFVFAISLQSFNMKKLEKRK